MKNALIELPENPHGLRIYNGIFDKSPEEIAEMMRQIEQLEALGTGRAAAAAEPGTGHRFEVGHRAGASAATNGFQSLGEFFGAVRAAGVSHQGGGTVDPRLILNAPSTVSTEGVGADGGFAVPPDFRRDIWQLAAESEDSLFNLTDRDTTVSATKERPGDELPPWSSSGPQITYKAEAGQLAQSKIALKSKTIRLNKATCLVPITSELMEDAPGIDGYLRKKVGQLMAFDLNYKILQGTGAGEPLGILNAPALVSVEKETGQTADTLSYRNLIAMVSRLYAPCYKRSVWIANPSILPQLFELIYPVTEYGTPATNGFVVAGRPVYQADKTTQTTPFGVLLNRPIIFTEAAETLGSKGDIFLADLSQYWTCRRTPAPKIDISMHLWFDYDVLAFRMTYRWAGLPWWSAPIDARDGSTTYSPFIALDERAEG